jgi:hypothetical protein
MTKPCTWYSTVDDGDWSTDCGNYFVLDDGTPSDNKMKFCCFCGSPIAEEIEEENDG